MAFLFVLKIHHAAVGDCATVRVELFPNVFPGIRENALHLYPWLKPIVQQIQFRANLTGYTVSGVFWVWYVFGVSSNSITAKSAKILKLEAAVKP